MMKNKLTLPLSALAACVALLATPVQAQTTPNIEPILISANQAPADSDKARSRQSLPDRSDWISLKDAFEALEKAGYKDLHGIHLSHHGYVARALDQDQKRVLLRVDPKTSAVTVHEARSKKGAKHKHRKSAEAPEA